MEHVAKAMLKKAGLVGTLAGYAGKGIQAAKGVAGKAMGALSNAATKGSAMAAAHGLAQPAGSLGRRAATGASRVADWVAGNPGKTLAGAGAVASGAALGRATAPAQQKQAELEKIGGDIGSEFVWPPKV